MSYLGRGLEQVDNISKLDNITFNGGTTYALTKDSSAFTPISSNALLVSIDGVIQQGNFSVSGTNIVFNFSPTSSNTCDFIMHYGTGVAFTPADSSVTKDKANFISTSSSSGLQIKGDGTTDGTLQLNCSQNSHGVKIKSPAHSASQSYTLTLPTTAPATDKIMQTDGSGNLSFVDAPSSTHVLVGSVNLAGGSTQYADITSCFSTTYNLYKVFIRRFIPIQNDNDLKLRYFNTSDNVADGTNYRWTRMRFRVGGEDRYDSQSDDNIQLINGVHNSDQTGGGNLELTIRTDRNTSGGNSFNIWWNGNVARNNDQASAFIGGGYYNDTTNDSAPKGLRFYTSNGNISQFKCVVYGVTGAL